MRWTQNIQIWAAIPRLSHGKGGSDRDEARLPSSGSRTSCIRVGTRVIDALNGARDALNASSHVALPALDLAIEVMAEYEVNTWSGLRYERVNTSAALGRIRAMAERALADESAPRRAELF